jgi:hypothetical protein
LFGLSFCFSGFGSILKGLDFFVYCIISNDINNP